MGITNNKILSLSLALLLGSINCQAFSNVDLNAGVSVSADYTDNVDLTASDTQSDLVFRVTPNISMTTEGSRLKTQLRYSVSGMAYSQTSSNNDIYHNLSSSADAEIIKNSIFLEAFANTRQVLLDQNQGASSDLVSGSQNTTTTYTYGLSPSWKKKWDNYASSDLSYSYDRVTFSGGNSTEDSTGNRVNFQLLSGTKFAQYFWDFNAENNETSYDGDSPDTKTETYYITLGYHYSRLLDLRVRFGYENYDNTVDDGFGWTIGGNWHPNERTSLDASWGERAFGRTASLDFSHRTKKITWQLNYSDTVNNSRGQLIENSQTLNQSIVNPVNNVNTPLSSFNSNLRLTRRLTGSASYHFRKSTLTWRLYQERLYYDNLSNKNNDNKGTSLGWDLSIGKRTSMNTLISWDRLEDLDIANTQNRKQFSIFLKRRLNRSLTGSIGYIFQTNDADLDSSEYEENRITATLSKTF